jgi:hypothetical protein
VKLDVLRQRGHRDRHELDDLREIAGEKMKVWMKMDGQSLDDPMMDGRSMVLMKMDAKKGDRLMVALVDRCLIDRCCVDALPFLTPIFFS